MMISILIITCILLTIANLWLFIELISLKAICANNFERYNENLENERKFVEEQDDFNKKLCNQMKKYESNESTIIGILNSHTDSINEVAKILDSIDNVEGDSQSV